VLSQSHKHVKKGIECQCHAKDAAAAPLSCSLKRSSRATIVSLDYNVLFRSLPFFGPKTFQRAYPRQWEATWGSCEAPISVFSKVTTGGPTLTSFPLVLSFLMLLLRTFFHGPGRPGCFSPTNLVIAARDEPLRSYRQQSRKSLNWCTAMSVFDREQLFGVSGRLGAPHGRLKLNSPSF
jgi:hypothetical protein